MLESAIPSSQVVSPASCVMAFGIPTSREEFVQACDPSGGREFAARNFYGNWTRYDREFVSLFRSMLPSWRQIGLQVECGMTLQDFREVLHSGACQVLVVFTHCNSEDHLIEFFDGMAPMTAVLDAIPQDFTGLIDFCACHPPAESLLVRIVKERPNCLVKFTPADLEPGMWVRFCHVLFLLLAETPMTYLAALEKTIAQFLPLSQPPQQTHECSTHH